MSLNYQLSAAIQQMGCGPVDINTLCGFLGLPCKSIQHHIKQVEHMMGQIQLSKRELLEEELVKMEIVAHEREEKGGVQVHACTIGGHEHPPLPKLKGLYSSYTNM